MTTIRATGSVSVHITGGVVDIERWANSKEPASWLALNYDNAERLGLALVEAARIGRGYEVKND